MYRLFRHMCRHNRAPDLQSVLELLRNFFIPFDPITCYYSMELLITVILNMSMKVFLDICKGFGNEYR